MSVSLSTATTEVRSLLDEATPVFWTDAQLQSWINQGCQDVARRAEILWNEWPVAVTPPVQTYPFPPDFLDCHRAEFEISGAGGPSGLTYNLEYRGINYMDEVWGILHSLPAAWPQYFTIRGNAARGFFLMLYPAPANSGQLTVYYYRSAKAAVAGTDNLDTMPGWEDIVYDYAVYKALRADRQPRWQEAFNLYEKNLAEMINRTRNMTDQGEQVTSGNPQWPSYIYSGDWG